MRFSVCAPIILFKLYKEKSMKRILTLILVTTLMFSLTSCMDSTKKETEFYDLVYESQQLLDEVADDIYSYWYDCIYDDAYLGNINYAIAAALSDNEDNIDIIESNNALIKDLYSQVKDGKLKSEIKAVMQAYNDYYAFVIEVSGSFKSYSENKESYKKELSSTLKDLEFEL